MTPKPGYAAGNILNMLVHLDADLTGYDFSGLSVWGAYLQGIEAQKLSLVRSDFKQSVFTDIFGGLLTVAFSPSDRFLAAGTTSGEIRIWRLPDLAQVITLDDHLGWVRSIAFSSDGKWLVSSGNDQKLCIWSSETWERKHDLLGHEPVSKMV